MSVVSVPETRGFGVIPISPDLASKWNIDGGLLLRRPSRAALDREDAAARDLERLWVVSEPCRISLQAVGVSA